MDPFVTLLSEELYTLAGKSVQIVVSIGNLVVLFFMGESLTYFTVKYS